LVATPPHPLHLGISPFLWYNLIIMCNSTTQKYGANPIPIKWNVVRGDTATLEISFLENDEITAFDTSDWTYKATAYDVNGDVLDEMITEATAGVVTITAPASQTLNWGTSYKTVVAELPFDLQVIIEVGSGLGEDTVWTPIVGTIVVLGDVSPGGSL
jgi:hypothetical protein